ncbi:hypothetical protein [Coleofasciculus sp. FACHB-1120]|uniref:hypothetical protein n=1 Tax=Coleofasciculus sp. FACHB-1120 TaxID=2692783 RepID=UPI001683BF7C|nr:hypothetical protein [Coleofasciculus sp. FACHB-1120]MBD2740879.1 hypothetical protein [Coleofasciculus sp. FACHB-1120]
MPRHNRSFQPQQVEVLRLALADDNAIRTSCTLNDLCYVYSTAIATHRAIATRNY